MANRFPLVVDTNDNNKIKELPAGDNLNLAGSGIINAGSIQTEGTLTAYNVIVNGQQLSTVAFSGDYADLNGAPTGFSGNYSDLVNKPTIPDTTRSLIDVQDIEPNDNDVLQWNSITGRYEPSAVDISFDLGDYTLGDIGNVIVTGDTTNKWLKYYSGAWRPASILYSDIQGTPTIPTIPTALSEFTNDVGFITSDTDSQTLSIVDDQLSISNGNTVTLTLPYSSITSTPTTLSGYGITDAAPINGAIFTGITTVPALKQTLVQGLLENNDTITLTATSARLYSFNPVGTNCTVYLPDDDDGSQFTFINPSYSGNAFTVSGALATFTVSPGETKSFLFDGVDWSLATTNTSPVGNVVGNFTLSNSTIDTDDSSAITITPAVVMSSDLTVQNDLTVNGDIITTSAGTPEVFSETEILLTAVSRVSVTQSPFKLASFTTAERDVLAAENGDMIYNTTDNKFQGYQNGTWINLDGTV